MKKRILLCLVVCVLCSAFTIHKFYVSIYRIDYSAQKKRLEITSRIFIDDLNAALAKKYGTHTKLGEKDAPETDIAVMNKYVEANFSVQLNGKPQKLHFVRYEIEDNVFVTYYTANDVPKPSQMLITNTALFDIASDQQNMIQVNVGAQKQSLLLTAGNPSGKIQF